MYGGWGQSRYVSIDLNLRINKEPCDLAINADSRN